MTSAVPDIYVPLIIRCDWGRAVALPDDSKECGRQATQRVMLHDADGGSLLLQFCPAHLDRVRAETTPSLFPPEDWT